MKVFKEEQRFTQWWVWLMLLSINTLFIFGSVKQIFFKTPFGNNPMNNIGLGITTFILILFTILFFSVKLKTKIDQTGIYYYFSPFQFKTKKIEWNTIESIRVIKYKPIQNYGGWGIKHGSYTVKGNIGLQVIFNNQKKILIGTQKENEIKLVLENYKNKLL